MKSDRVIVLTGAGGGIGAALASRFLLNSDTVIATDSSAESLRLLEKRNAGGGQLATIVADVTVESEVVAVMGLARERAERIDVLINCAGYFPIQPFLEISVETWRRVLDINLTGVFLTIRHALPLMKGRGWGRIINFGSGTFFKGTPFQSHYIAAKAGVIGLSRSLATELGAENITVNVVTPGLTETEAVKRTMSAEFLAQRRVERPLKRAEVAEDLVGSVFFLASPDADFITGQIINVDGGSAMH
jgi:NAD(P)-dependent dehydrogenase (short-subunit alcohol dehydrogenase family)